MKKSKHMTVYEVSKMVNKDSGYVRQHIHRGHLPAHRDERGHVAVDPDDAIEWAIERNLTYVPETDMSGVTHAIIMPFPVANLVTWCGHRCDSRAVKNDFIADSPEAVTCQRCMEVMREAHGNLEKWIPKLSVK